MGDLVQQLEAEYCPPIDSALFSAIIFDYDLTNPESAQEARATLDALKATAVEEEATGFDPSGSGSQRHDYSPGHPSSAPDTTESTSRETDMTSLSNGVSSVDLDRDTSPDETDVDLESLDQVTKTALLKELFPSLTDYNITHTLAQHDNRWKPALDDLLNQVYFSEDGMIDGKDKVSVKGVDAFGEENLMRRGRKGKKGGKNLKTNDALKSASLPSSASSSRAPTNRWQTAKDDVDFISDRANIPPAVVQTLYNQNDHSVPRTISAILKNFVQEDNQSEEAQVQINAHELGVNFPTIAPTYLTALIKLTQPSTVAAHELAKALTTRSPHDDHQSTILIPQYAPVQLPLGDDAVLPRVTSSYMSSIDLGVPSTGFQLSSARHTAMEQARAAYRKSRSDRLMGGVAGYYSQVGRDYGAALQQHNAAEADALVASQSSALEIDLHGVTVQDAVRIARRHVQSWWYSLGENKVNGRLGAVERASGFRIITGVGRHSQGGKGVLGPAVKKNLELDGWKVESGSGALIVKGKAKQS